MQSRREKREEEEIKKEAKRILDKFAKALSKVKVKEGFVEREEDRRQEGEGKEADKDFISRFLDNAPSVKKGCVLAERGGWK